MSGISVRTIQRIERGKPANAETLKCIGAALDIDFNILREGTNMQLPTSSQDQTLTEQEREALEYVRDVKGFYEHAIYYLVALVMLGILNLWTSPEKIWVGYVAMGWGIGLAAHGLSVFEVVNIFGPEWERRQIERRLRR